MITINSELLAADLQAFVNLFEIAVQEESVMVVNDMAIRAQSSLREMDTVEGHTTIASMWTYDLQTTTDGVSAEVYSAAEGVTFFNRTGASRVQSSLYPIQGDRLLAILEGGAGAHEIFPGTVNPMAKALSIPIPGSEARAKELLRKHGPGMAVPIEFRKSVNHPGVKPDSNVEFTVEKMLLLSDSFAEAAAQGIANRF